MNDATRRARRAVLLVLACPVLVALTAGGCSSKAEKSIVNGTITLDGAPLKAGQIGFRAADGAAPTAGAAIDEGRFTAELAPGAYVVEITAPKVVGKRKAYDTPDSPTVDIVEELLPSRYNTASELRLEVRAGEQDEKFELQTE